MPVLPTQILPPTRESLESAVAALRAGEPVAIPTETVYGLAADALNEAAVVEVFRAKARPAFDPLIVHVGRGLDRIAALTAAGIVAAELPAATVAQADRLMAAFWPGPLTLVLPRGPKISDLVTSGLPRVGVRMPAHPVALELLALLDGPVAAPSANRFGRISPTTAQDVVAELAGLVRLIVDGGPCERGIESTVLALEPSGDLILLRPGALARERIETVAGRPLTLPDPSAPLAGDRPAPAPGMTASHYAPVRAVMPLPAQVPESGQIPAALAAPWAGARVGLLATSGDASVKAAGLRDAGCVVVAAESLSETGDAATAARNLFGALRRLDRPDIAMILAEPCPRADGLWHAIADRLRRAAAPRGAGGL